MLKQIKISLGVILLLGGSYGLRHAIGYGNKLEERVQAQSQQSGQRGKRVTAVDVAIARTGWLRPEVIYTGNTLPLRTVSVRSRLEGRLLTLNLDVGDQVKKGQNIGQLDDILLVTSLQQAEAELAALQSEVARAKTQVTSAQTQAETARLELLQATSTAQRQQKLLLAGAISQQQAEEATTAATIARERLKATQEQIGTEQQAVAALQSRVLAQTAVVAQTKERRSYTRLISPIEGVVTQKLTEPGNILQAGNEVLKIADFSRVKIQLQVSELELSQIQIGQLGEVSLDALPNQSLTGKVTRISPAADANGRFIPVEVIIRNPNGKIGSGLLARVKFTSPTPQRVIVSQMAVQSLKKNHQSAQIFTIAEVAGNSKVSERIVRIGNKADGNVEILSGLKPGEKYVVRSSRPLKSGQAVVTSALSE